MKLIFLILLLNMNVCLGQWTNLGGGLNAQGRVLYFDTTTSNLIVIGNFNTADTLVANHIAYWNGQQWGIYGSGAPHGAPGYGITKFQNEIYLSSIFYPSVNPNWLAKWSGTSWDTISPNVAGPVFCFYQKSNELYLGGSFQSIGSDTTQLLAKYNGSIFTAFPLPCSWGHVSAIEFFQGHMYVGGNFFDTIPQTNDLEYFDGNTFFPFGGGLGFGADYVSSMAIYNNELYIGGSFSMNSGAVGNNIMSWDGLNMRPLALGLNGPVYKIKVYPDGLYVCGVFNMADSLPVSGIAKWNGINWESVISYYSNLQAITDFVIVGNDLYITGLFSHIDTLPVNNIAKYSFPVSIIENLDKQGMVFPNPTTGSFSIKSSFINGDISIIIKNIMGQTIKEYIKDDESEDISGNLNEFSDGLYFITVSSGKMTQTFKIIKHN